MASEYLDVGVEPAGKPTSLSSIVKKVIMGLSGLFLCVYLVVHLAGNLMLLKRDGGAAFNQYAMFMEHFWLTQILEVVLFAGFFIHILDGIILTIQNKGARPVKYAVSHAEANSSWFSRNMGFTGGIVFFFLVVHLKNFFIDQRFFEVHSSMYQAAIDTFKNPWYVGLYITAIAVLGLHLNHGFQSAFQSIGLNHPRYTRWLKIFGTLFAIVVPIGFILIPFYLYFFTGGA